ncbi:MAG: 4Fe-4S dicluster domain-containing protein [Desulfobacterales bacterium]|nr:4Fe-4S dicluster domain-containing protein [Desulfobacterales bacterium]MDX2511221.1 4Fe-4S dicluster domain-containing protein [Desulfobacterales bacterium]
MIKTVKIDIKDQDLLGTFRALFKNILEKKDISAILAPWRLPTKTMVMPTLLTDPDQLKGVDPLSPAFPINSAKIVSKLTRKSSGGNIAAVMRPCEIRAFVELVKLKQARTEELILIGVDCLGAIGNRDYLNGARENSDQITKNFVNQMLSGKPVDMDGIDLTQACRSCELPLAQGADINIGLFGVDTSRQLLVQALTDKGSRLLEDLDLATTEEPASRRKEIDRLISEKTAFRDNMFADVENKVGSLEKLNTYLAGCVNCYNCRVACPVCYCRECVFVTDVFDHEPNQYLQWARKKGAVKMPTDTLLYHITRLAHMSTACVGCGQCTNACPNDIEVMPLFRMIAHKTQKAFDYEAGRNLEEKPPLSEFKEDEFAEIVGLNN